MNVGLDFNVENCMKWIKVLKRTEAFGCEIELRRVEELERLASQVRERVSSLSTTDSADGVDIEWRIWLEMMLLERSRSSIPRELTLIFQESQAC